MTSPLPNHSQPQVIEQLRARALVLYLCTFLALEDEDIDPVLASKVTTTDGGEELQALLHQPEIQPLFAPALMEQAVGVLLELKKWPMAFEISIYCHASARASTLAFPMLSHHPSYRQPFQEALRALAQKRWINSSRIDPDQLFRTLQGRQMRVLFPSLIETHP